MPVTPTPSRAMRTSSHLCGLMTAVTSFMTVVSCSDPQWRTLGQARARAPTVHGSGARALMLCGRPSDGGLVLLTGAHPHDALDRRDPHLAVTDPAGLRRLDDDVGDLVGVHSVDD